MVFTDKAIESLCRKNEAGKSGFYPVGKYNCWHSGIHLTTDAAITPVIRGTIVSFKISEKYEELSDDRKCPSSFILIKHSVSLPAGKNKAVLEFFTFYTLIRPDTESALVKKYSNTFVVLDEKLSERTPFYREWKFRVNSNKTKSYYIYDGNEDIFEGSEGYIDDQNFLGAGHYTNDGYQCKMGVLEKDIFVRSGYFKVKDPNALILVKPKNAGVKYFRVEADNLRDENASGTVKNNTVKAYQEPVYIKGIKCLTLKGSGAENFKHNEKNGYVYVSEITKHIPNSIYAYAKKDKTYFYNIELITENAKQYFTVCVYKDFEAMKREITELSTIRLLFTNWNLLLNRNNLIRDLDAQFKDDTEDIGCIDSKRLVLIYNEEYTWVPEGSVPDTDKDYYDVLVFEEMVAPYRIYLKSTLFKAVKEYMEKSKEGQGSVRKVFRKLEADKSAKLHVCRINRRSDYIQNPENMELNEEDIKVCVTGNILMRAKSRIREKEYSEWIVRAEDMNLVKGPAIKMSERTASLKRYTVSKKRGLMLYNMVSGAPEKIIGAGDEILLMGDSDEFLMSDAKPVRKEVVVGDKRYHAYIDSRDCLEGKLVIKQRFMEGGSFFGKIITKEIPISPYDCLGYGTEYNFSAERQNKTHELILFFKDRGFTKLKAEKNIVHIAAGSTLQKVVINKNCAVKQKFRLKTTFAIEEEKEMFGNVIYKVRLDSVPIFFSNKQLEIIKDKRKTATNVDRIWLYDCKVTADTIKEGTYYTRQNASILIEMLQGNIAELSNKTYKFITLNNAKDCSELEVNTKQLSKIFYLKETKGLLKDEAKHTFTVGSNHLELEVYKENPYTVEESKQAQEEEFREGEKAITRYNGKEYVLLKKESDSVCEYVEYKGLKKVNLFDWKQFFYIAEQDANDDVFCDVKEEILDQIALTDEVKNKIAQAFERDESLQEALAGEEAVRVSLRKIIVGHPLEFDAALYENEEVFKKKGCTPESCKRLKEDVKSVSFWDDIKIKEKNALVFAHPLYFLNHLNKAGVFEFNPYEGKTYRELYVGNGENKLYDGGDYGAKIVSSNPGFAAVFNSRCWGKSFDGYTGVTGFFNADYKAVHSDYTEYWHEGIDFRGKTGATIVSLVYGTVLRCGKAVSASMGGFILIKSLTDENLYYLAIHLDANTIKNYVEQGSTISPGMQVAETMLLRNSDGKNVSHLHVSAVKLPEGVNAESETGIIMPDENTFPIWGQERTKNQEIWKNMINPFDYNDLNTWKGRY